MIDCDIHNELPSLDALLPYLPDYWCDYINESAFVGPDANDYPANAPITASPSVRTVAAESQTRPASTLAQIQTQVLDQILDTGTVDYGILTCSYRVPAVHHPDLAAALATAVNRWQVEHWLEPEPRLRASIVIPSQNAELAAKEIDRWGDHPGFVQVMLPVRSLLPYGNRIHDPIYAAATRHDLAVGIHYGGAPGHPSTPSGWPSTFIEEYAGMSQVFQSQVMSLIVEGSFDRFPDLRVALIEGGFTWMPSLMWRLDKEWRGLRHNIPWVKQPPSEYIHKHIRLTTQPIDAPHEPDYLCEIIEQLDSEDLLMYASDYPHWHADDPRFIFDIGLPDALEQRILDENARIFYQL
ncbi:MAG: amidohydrolase family protein [Chloroflexota bacterium]